MIRKITLLSFTIGASLLFILQLMSLQLFNSDYSELSLNNAVEERPVFPNRGLIYDRNGILLVKNQPAYDLMVIPENQESFDTLELTSVLNISKQDLITQLKKAERFSNKASFGNNPTGFKRNTCLFFRRKCGNIRDFIFKKRPLETILFPSHQMS